MRLKKKSSILALACLSLLGILPAYAATVDSVDTDKIVVNGTAREAAFDSKGGLWVTAGQDNSWGIKHIDLATKKITTYSQSPSEAEGIVEGPDGNMWFSSRLHGIGRIAGGVVTHFGVPGDYGRAWHLAPGPDGALWFTASEYETVPGSKGAIGRIATDGVITMYPLDHSRNVNVTKITKGPDGAMWATAPNTNEIVRITMQGEISYFPATVDIGDNAGIVAGPDGNLWYTTGVSRATEGRSVVRMDRDGKVLNTYSGDYVRQPSAIVVGKDGNIWFSNAHDGSTIGRITMDGKVDALVPPRGYLPLQYGMAHNPATGDLWTVEPLAHALERYPTMGYTVRVAMTGDRTLDEAADATKNYAPVADKQGKFFLFGSWGEPDGDMRVEAWSYNVRLNIPDFRWHLRKMAEPGTIGLMNVKSGSCMTAGNMNVQKPCTDAQTQGFVARPTALDEQFTLFNAAGNKCADLWYGYNYATVHPRGNYYGGHYPLGGSYIGMYECKAHYNQRFSFE